MQEDVWNVEHVEEIEEKALDTCFNATSLAEGYGTECW